MILKFETDQDEVYFVEATGNKGVSISKWSAIKPFIGKFYEKVVFRHLFVDRTDDMIDKLETFLREVVGNKYGISTSKIMQRKTVKARKGVYIDDDRTFFCSELVAKGYKVLGVMEDDDRACSSYYPSSFSTEKNDLKLLNDGHLGPQ